VTLTARCLQISPLCVASGKGKLQRAVTSAPDRSNCSSIVIYQLIYNIGIIKTIIKAMHFKSVLYRVLFTADHHAARISESHRLILQSVQLPSFMRPIHSIETTNNVFIVSHWDSVSCDQYGVSEVNSEGHVTRAFNGLLNSPEYLTLVSFGRILVLDEKHDVLLLNGELKYERVLLNIKKTTGWRLSPRVRMCYHKKTRSVFCRQ